MSSFAEGPDCIHIRIKYKRSLLLPTKLIVRVLDVFSHNISEYQNV